MGCGNTKNVSLSQGDEKLIALEEKANSKGLPKQRQDFNVNKTKSSQENENNNVCNGSVRKKTEANEKENSIDSNSEETQPEDVQLKLLEKGFTDDILVTHCKKTPQLIEIFISVYEAMKVLKEKMERDEFLDVQRQATVFTSSYSKVKKKIALGNFLVDVGFARIAKEIYLKLNSAFPDLLTYDRELDENLKPKDEEKCIEDETDKTTESSVQPVESSVQPVESSVQPVESSVQPVESSVQPVESSVQPVESSVQPVESSVQPVESSVQPVESSVQPVESSVQPVESSVQPVESSVQPVESSVQPVESSVKPVESSVQPVESSVQPVESSVQPVESSVQPVESSVQPVESSVQPVESSVQPVESSVQPVESSVQPVESSVQPVESSVQPVESSVQPAESSVQPVESSVQPVESSVKPVESSVQPVESSVQPLGSTKSSAESDVKNEHTAKSLDIEEKKANPLLKAQNLFSKIMLSAINYTDACDAMNLALSDEGFVPLLVDALAKLMDCTAHHVKYMNEDGGLKTRTVRGSILTKVLGTLHNMSKRVPTRPKFHACNAIRIILPLIDDKINRFATDALLILAYLIDEENNNLIMANEGPIKYLISLISKATKKPTHRYLGYTNSELAQGLSQIAINDSNKKKIVSCGAIPILTQMIEEAKSEKEKITAAEALWMLAFDEDNRQKMKNNDKCIGLLNKMKESDNEKTKKAASGALWEIVGKKNATNSATDKKSSSATTNHVMISYQWDVQKTLIQVKDRLQAAGYRVWMDLEQMGGSTLEAMAKAVENSAVVLVCVSQKYKESSNCRSEAEYAFQLHKDIIPLMMENNYRPDGWLGMIMGSKLWIDFSIPHLSKVETSVKDLIKELGVRGKEDAEIVPVMSIDVLDAEPNIDISGWTQEDVIHWMKGFGLVMKNKKSVGNLTGPILTRLNKFRNEVSPEFYYSSLKEDFGFSRMIDVLIFSDELKKLLT